MDFSEFLKLSPEKAAALVASDEQVRAVVRTHAGDRAADEYRRLGEAVGRRDAEHLALEHVTNLLFLPGIMGSVLGSGTLGGVWWLDLTNLGRLNDLRLSPSGDEDAQPDFAVQALTTDHRYVGFLTAALMRPDFGHDRFPYDWRRAIESRASGLKDRLVAIRAENGGSPIHIVAHSMGGLVVRAALARHGDELWPILGRIVFIATPHFGAPAIAGYLKNHFWGWDKLVVLGKYLDRTTFRSLRGALELLPAPRGVYPGTRSGEPDHPCANFDLYQADAWKLDLHDDERARLQQALDDAATFHRDMWSAHSALDQALRDRMCVIAGVGIKTLFRLDQKDSLGIWEHTKKITDRISGDPNRDGDGRVPVASAALDNVGAIRYVKGVHGGLPNIPAVYGDAFRWLKGEPLQLPSSPAGALGEHLSADLQASTTPALDGSAALAGDDPGYLHLAPDQAGVARLEAEIQNGRSPDFLDVSLL